MARSEREVVERLGAGGLSRVLHDLLDHARLVRLANAVGLAYPGMRAQSQKKPRLVRDLADRATRDEAAGRAVVRTLRKENHRAIKEWTALPTEERTARLTDPAVASQNGRLGGYLFAAAAGASDPAVDAAVTVALSSVAPSEPVEAEPAPAGPEPPDRDIQRLQKKCAELQKKVRYLEGQIARTKDVEKTYKRDLLQRKGELAETRMLAERLRKENEELKTAQAEGPTPKPPAVSDDEIERALRRLASEQRRLAHRIETWSASPPPAATIPADALDPVALALAELHKDVTTLRRERKKDLQDQTKRLDDLAARLVAATSAIEASPKASRSAARKKGEPERVGVFIDVQNMYYAARQLKGKLDFDALLQAAVLDRRLILATAYVVESKEIDQSGFIAMLQQRAIEVRRKTLKVRSDGSMKGDWDMEMALDILDMAPKLDVVVFVSGDGDFTSLVKRVKSMGPKVEVIAFPRNTAKSLLEAADRFHPLDRKAMIRVEAAGVDPEPVRADLDAAPPPAPPKPA